MLPVGDVTCPRAAAVRMRLANDTAAEVRGEIIARRFFGQSPAVPPECQGLAALGKRGVEGLRIARNPLEDPLGAASRWLHEESDAPALESAPTDRLRPRPTRGRPR